MAVREQIIQRLEGLPEPELHEVLDFVEFLAWKNGSHSENNRLSKLEDDPFLSVMGTLPGAALTNEEIDLELYGPVTVEERRDEA